MKNNGVHSMNFFVFFLPVFYEIDSQEASAHVLNLEAYLAPTCRVQLRPLLARGRSYSPQLPLTSTRERCMPLERARAR